MKFTVNHFWVFIGFIFFSCLKEPYRAPIYVNTKEANEIKATSVKLHADVQSPDAGEITDRGFYWTANDSAATVLKNKISLGPGSGEFTYMLKNLQAKKAYSFFRMPYRIAIMAKEMSKPLVRLNSEWHPYLLIRLKILVLLML